MRQSIFTKKPSMNYFNNHPIFSLGEIIISPGVSNLGIDPTPLLRRHQECDWSQMSAEDVELNKQALANSEAIVSRYHVTIIMRKSVMVTIVTEDDRSYTLIFMESEAAPAG